MSLTQMFLLWSPTNCSLNLDCAGRHSWRMWQNFTVSYMRLMSLPMQNFARPPYWNYWQGIKNHICTVCGLTIKFANLILKGLFFMNLYQLDKQLTKFTIWKYWKGCVKKLDGNDPNFLPTTHGSCITTNAPAHTALSVREFLTPKQITMLEHPAYSPDLAPTDFFLFAKIKGNIERKAFWWHWWHQE